MECIESIHGKVICLTDTFLDNIARNLITAFLMLFNLAPSEGDSTEVRNEWPYRVYSTQVKIPSGTVIDIENMYQELTEYLQRFNSTPTVIAKFYPHHIESYRCPCGCGEFLYVVFYTC